MIFRYPDPVPAPSYAPLLLARVVAQGETVAVDVRGEVDIATVEPLMEAVRHALAERPERLSIRLGSVSFFSAAGLHALLAARRMASEQAADLVLTAPSRQVLHVLELAHVKELFKVEDEPPPRVRPPNPAVIR